MTSTKNIINKRTVLEFVEQFSEWYVLRTITKTFDGADILYDESYEPNVSGARRTLVHKYLATLDLTKWPDARRLLDVFEDVLVTLEEMVEKAVYVEEANDAIRRLKKLLARDGFNYEDGRINSTVAHPNASSLGDVATRLNSAYLHQQIQTMNQAVEENPALAIGTAKELIETTCKTILEDRGESFSPKQNLLQLVKQTATTLKLVPKNVPDSAKGAESIKMILGSLASVAHGIAELRNPYGSGHGKSARVRGLEPRHARLAVGAAATLSVFQFETHEKRSQLLQSAPKLARNHARHY
ncbi:MAG: hypothetical protein DHS20C16_16570 [Phycisphaerae bacterium]|nr:MAG: hypothetical protein DHS20C16_16570 [Phycisphaerae bacterium]